MVVTNFLNDLFYLLVSFSARVIIMPTNLKSLISCMTFLLTIKANENSINILLAEKLVIGLISVMHIIQ